MRAEYKKLIDEKVVKEIAGGMNCPKNFQCTNFESAKLCQAQDIGKDNCLECQERNPCDCPYVIDIGFTSLCRCPLRVYIAKNL